MENLDRCSPSSEFPFPVLRSGHLPVSDNVSLGVQLEQLEKIMAKCPKQVSALSMTTVDDGLVVKDHNLNRVHYLNHTAGFVLMLCDGKKSIPKIEKLLRIQFKLGETSENEVADIITQFLNEKLIVMKKK